MFPPGYTCPAVLWILAMLCRFRIRDFHPLRWTFPGPSPNSSTIVQVRTPAKLLQLVWPPPRSLATTSGISVDVFSWPYLDVSVQAVPHVQLWIHCTLTQVCCAGFPHSEIHGSMLICSSPWLIAACHVFRRLLMPRHSPCTLYSLTSSAQAPHPSCPPGVANTHSFRCASSRSENRLRWVFVAFAACRTLSALLVTLKVTFRLVTFGSQKKS